MSKVTSNHSVRVRPSEYQKDSHPFSNCWKSWEFPPTFFSSDRWLNVFHRWFDGRPSSDTRLGVTDGTMTSSAGKTRVTSSKISTERRTRFSRLLGFALAASAPLTSPSLARRLDTWRARGIL